MKKHESVIGIRFLGIVFLGYGFSLVLQPTTTFIALNIVYALCLKILPVMVIVFVIMVVFNFLVTPSAVARYLGKSSGCTRWLVAIVAGIIATGPIYVWYALLKEWMYKGMGKGVSAAFLYARAIKPFILPLMIYYFGWRYTAVLTGVMIFFSLVQGILMERILER